jgi:hypothetical protein
MRKHKLYANLQKCLFGVDEIPVLGDLVGINGVRPDPEKIKTIVEWPTPLNVKDVRKFLGLTAYLHKHSKNFAGLARPLSQMLRKEVEWSWTNECQEAFVSLKRSLVEAPILAIADHSKPFFVVCDASDFAIGCALMQLSDDGKERVVSFQSRQLRPAERNYPVHDKELLSMKYALTKFRVYLLGSKPFSVFTDHASLRTAIKSPHLSQRMARWLSFFADYNFTVHYKPGKANILADALSRRSDYESSAASVARINGMATIPSSALLDEIKCAYNDDPLYAGLYCYLSDPTDKRRDALDASTRCQLHRFELSDGIIYYRTDDGDAYRIAVPNDDDLRRKIMHEFHDVPTAGHLGREKTYLSLARNFYWANQYKSVRKYIRTCEVCQRVKPSACSQAPLHSLPVPSDCWKSISMDFVFGLPNVGNKTGVLVFVDRFSKMVHLTAVSATVSAKQSAIIFIDSVFKLHGMPMEIVSDRDPRFTSRFWQEVFKLVGTNLLMSTTAHPETDGQTERVNRVLGDILRSYATSFEDWTALLPLAEFAINNSVHASTGMTPFYVNGLRHPRLPANLANEVCFPLRKGGTVTESLSKMHEQAVMNTTSLHASIDEDETISSSNTMDACERAVIDSLPKENGRTVIKSLSNMNKQSVMNTTSLDVSIVEDETISSSNKGYEKRLQRAVIKSLPKQNKGTVLEPLSKSYAQAVMHSTSLDEDEIIPSSNELNESFDPKRHRSRSNDFVLTREAVVRFVRDSIALAIDMQKKYADKRGRKNTRVFKINSLVLLSTTGLPAHAVSCLGSNKLLPRFIGPFKVLKRLGEAYTLDIPSVMRLHPTFYVGRLKEYHRDEHVSRHDHEHPRVVHPRGETGAPLTVEGAFPLSRSVETRPSYPHYRHVRDHRERPPPPLLDSQGAVRYHIEDIVGHSKAKSNDGKPRHYLVKWQGYSNASNTWEPRDSLLEDVPDHLIEYENEHSL